MKGMLSKPVSNDSFKVSVIIPVHNNSHTLARAVRSALRQTIKPELIIIDDASTDGSSDLIRKWDRKDNVKTITNAHNLGPGPSRNLGIESASGEFVAFLEADDFYPDKNSLRSMYELAQSECVDICGSRRQFRIGYRKFDNELFRDGCKLHPEGFTEDFSENQWEYDFTNYIYRRSFLKEDGVEFPSLKRYQDVVFQVKAMSLARTFAVANVVGYCFTMQKKHQEPFSGLESIDILRGMRTVLDISEKEGYDLLIARTGQRLKEEYLPRIPKDVQEEPEIQSCIDEIIGYADHHPTAFSND